MPVMESSSNLSQSMDSVNTVPGEEEVGQGEERSLSLLLLSCQNEDVFSWTSLSCSLQISWPLPSTSKAHAPFAFSVLSLGLGNVEVGLEIRLRGSLVQALSSFCIVVPMDLHKVHQT